DDLRIGDQLLGVGRGLGRIILAGSRRAAVVSDDLDLVARDAALGVRFVDGDLETVLDLAGVVRVGTSERQRDAELDGLLLSLGGDEAAGSRKRGHARDGGNVEGTARMLGLLHGLTSLTTSLNSSPLRARTFIASAFVLWVTGVPIMSWTAEDRAFQA